MGDRLRRNKRRESLDKRIKEAQKTKPTASMANNQGLTAEQVETIFGKAKIPRKIGQKGGIKTGKNVDPRPKLVEVKKTPGPEITKVQSTLYPVPKWFLKDEPCDVSIIVPLFKSKEAVMSQINSWDIGNDGLSREIIYVDDGCPENSHTKIVPTWEKRSKSSGGIGKIVINKSNGGFSAACNSGFSYAKGKYVIFLNADTEVTPNWVKPMIEIMEEDKSVGIVGNMQVGTNGSIDSAGSQWSWDTKSFRHIGKYLHGDKKLTKAYTAETLPKDLKQVQPRDMVTGCCIALPYGVFLSAGGFDEIYRIGYWEDADLSLKVKSLGYKVFYQPRSVIHHKVGHSRAGGHKWMKHNTNTFHDRWLKTGRIDKLIQNGRPDHKYRTIKHTTKDKVVGCVIACNEEEFLRPTVESVSSLVDEWVFVIGGNEYAYKSGMCDERGYPTDSTLDIAKELAKKYNGLVIEPPGRVWHDKVEMRNAYAKLLNPGDWMFMCDGDEVYDTNQLWRMTEIMSKYEVAIIQFWLFWNDMNTLGTGKWQQYPQERLVHWQKGYCYKNNHLHVSNAHGKLVNSIQPCYRGNEKLFYHYSWVRPVEKIRQKIEYYKHQSGIKQSLDYVDDVFLKWRNDSNSVQGLTHPVGGGGTEPFKGIHPIEIREMMNRGELQF